MLFLILSDSNYRMYVNLLLRTVTALQDGRLCSEVALKWEDYYHQFERVFTEMPTATPKDRQNRLKAANDIPLPPVLDKSFFGKWFLFLF